MNFPDLETYKAIAKEFPESEFVYCMAMANTRIEYREGHYKETIICPAPTCEELGEWLWNKDRLQVVRMQGADPSKLPFWYIIDHSGSTVCNCFQAKNETQARSEAVKLILESRK